MVLFLCKLRVSPRARLISLLLHGSVVAWLLLACGSGRGMLPWFPLLALVLVESFRSQRRIQSWQGSIELLDDQRLRWRGLDWRLSARPWLSRQAILLSLLSEGGRRERLWLFSDAMDASQWRRLRLQLLNLKRRPA